MTDDIESIYNTIEDTELQVNNKITVWGIRRTLIVIAFFDLILTVINSIVFYPGFISCIFILLGICGINRYNKYISGIYGALIFIKIIGLFTINIINWFDTYLFIFGLANLFANIWLTELICKFIYYLNKLKKEDIEILIDGYEPHVIKIMLI